MRKKTAIHIIEKAAETIGEFGWTRGTLRNRRGEVCLFGAVQVGGVRGEYDPSVELRETRRVMKVMDILSDLAVELYPERHYNPRYECLRAAVQFNDNQKTTKEDVLALLNTALVRMGQIGKQKRIYEVPEPVTVPDYPPVEAPAKPVREEPKVPA